MKNAIMVFYQDSVPAKIANMCVQICALIVAMVNAFVANLVISLRLKQINVLQSVVMESDKKPRNVTIIFSYRRLIVKIAHWIVPNSAMIVFTVFAPVAIKDTFSKKKPTSVIKSVEISLLLDQNSVTMETTLHMMDAISVNFNAN